MPSPFLEDPTDFGPLTGNTAPSTGAQAPGNTPPSRASTQGDVHWKLETIEPVGLAFKNFTVIGQFPAKDGITVRMDQVVADAATYNMTAPFVQWVRSELQTISFDVILFSRDKDEDILARFNQMLRLQSYVAELGRIPICRFSFGDIISVKCIVVGFGDVKIGRPKVSGQARSIEFTMSLKRFTPFKVPTQDANKPVKKSLRKIFGNDDRMYESIARKHYGINNAIYGVRLRRELENRGAPFVARENSSVQIPRADKVVVGRITPIFHGFQLGRSNVAQAFQERIAARNGRFLVT